MSKQLVRTELEKLKIGVKGAIEAVDGLKIPCQSKDLDEFGKKLEPLFRFSSLCDELIKIEEDCDNKASTSIIVDTFNYISLHLAEQVKLFLKKAIKAYPSIFNAQNGNQLEFAVKLVPIKTKDIPAVVVFYCCTLLSVLVNLTDRHEDTQRACCQDGLVSFIFKEIFPILTNIHWDKNTMREEMMNRSMDIVYNCCKLPANHKCYEDVNAVDVLVKMREETNHLEGNDMNTTALLTLGFLIDESNNDKIIFGHATVETLIKYLKKCLQRVDHVAFGFHAEELANGLQHLSVPDENQILICDQGGHEVLAMLLLNAINDAEIISSCNALWSLCFSEKGKLLTKDHEELLTSLNQLRDSEKLPVKEAAVGVLWQLRQAEENEEHVIASDGRTNGEVNGTGHIMLSYQWDNQKMVTQIANNLNKRGYNVWIDIERIQGNIMDAMAEAVEQASVIIVCISRKYKMSANTRAEADYAFQLKKKVIPIMMEKDYTPDGWIGLLLGSKLRIDFTSLDLFIHNIDALCKQLDTLCPIMETVIVPGVAYSVDEPNLLGQEPYLGHHPLIPLDVMDSGGIKSPASSCMNGEKMDEISNWQHSQVVEWVEKNSMNSFIKKGTLRKLTGVHLVMLYKLRRECPKYYYTNAGFLLDIRDLLDFLTFTNQIDKLLE